MNDISAPFNLGPFILDEMDCHATADMEQLEIFLRNCVVLLRYRTSVSTCEYMCVYIYPGTRKAEPRLKTVDVCVVVSKPSHSESRNVLIADE